MLFNELNLKSFLLTALEEAGYKEATEIQSKVIPFVLEGKDVIGKSHTGSGKTASFVLPILQTMNCNFRRPQALIICPTRELARQVFDQVKKYGKYLSNLRSVLVCGGQKREIQIKMLKFCNLIIGTPGRIVDHISHGSIRLDFLKTIVLDEADEMLKLGFKKDMDFIFASLFSKTQTLLFSATIPPVIKEMSSKYQKDPVLIEIKNDQKLKEKIDQYYINLFGNDKTEVLVKLFEKFNPELSIVFCNTKVYTEKIAAALVNRNINTTVINGDKKQWERNMSMKKFRQGHIKVLVATDVAARGLDINGIDYVFNFDLPLEQEIYVHRIGRTARAGASGKAITIIANSKELNDLKKIEKYQQKTLQKLELAELGLKSKTVNRFNKNSRFNHNN